MRRLTWAPAALEDLAGIERWFIDRDPSAGARILRGVRTSVQRLGDYPRIGRAIDEPFRVLGVRATPYVLVYRLRGEDIEIIRLRHRHENWMPAEGEL